MNANRPRTRLCLLTPELDEPAAFGSVIEPAVAAGDVAAVLLRLNDSDERTLINRAKAVASRVQRHGIALILDGRPELAARAGADGAHLTGIEALRAAIALLKPDRITGAGGLRSRDDAMLAGEADADYVMFGEPDRGETPLPRPGFSALLERVAWWAELFQPPCIGYAAQMDEIRPLAEAGADFVALGEWIWREPGGAERAVAAATESLIAAVT